MCFNPYRVFKFVATTGSDVSLYLQANRFNPYRVFKFVATCRCYADRPARQYWFQSLSGFQVRCNAFTSVSDDWISSRFQSLSGFQVRCNTGIMSCRVSVIDDVSIPIGFSSSLQPEFAGSIAPCQIDVSIPIGFSSSLQLCMHGQRYSLDSSFNPYRVFKFVATIVGHQI